MIFFVLNVSLSHPSIFLKNIAFCLQAIKVDKLILLLQAIKMDRGSSLINHSYAEIRYPTLRNPFLIRLVVSKLSYIAMNCQSQSLLVIVKITCI